MRLHSPSFELLLPVLGRCQLSNDCIIADTEKGERERDWCEYVSHSGSVCRRIIRKQSIGERLSSIGIFNIVRKRGEMMGKLELAPHDLRRTYAQLGYEAGIPITQIGKLLGHASIATTQRYLNLELDLETTISDFIPFE